MVFKVLTAVALLTAGVAATARPTLRPVLVNQIVPPASPVGAVPEPATWAMMVIGFGVVGVARRRRRSVAA